jgi:hypothetical protein
MRHWLLIALLLLAACSPVQKSPVDQDGGIGGTGSADL